MKKELKPYTIGEDGKPLRCKNRQCRVRLRGGFVTAANGKPYCYKCAVAYYNGEKPKRKKRVKNSNKILDKKRKKK